MESLRVAIVAGEACPAEVVSHHARVCPNAHLFNEYGPTEAAVWSSVAECNAADERRRVPIGRPISNARIYVLDSRLSPVPVGVHREIHIAGKGLARGYLGQPGLTAERFIPDMFSREAGSRLYRTGDLGRSLPNGEIDFLGRNDFQVKLRGMRIELGEIESVLKQHAMVTDAVVMLRQGEPAREPRIVAYVVSKVSAKSLREYLKATLPDYMAPSAFVSLDQIPLTAGGKVDRAALRAPLETDSPDIADYEEPETPVEKVIAGIWEEVLGRKRIGASDNFFEVGGHSLIATQVMSRIREAFRVDVGLRKLFEEPTVRGLARVIVGPPGTRARVEKTAELLLSLRGLSDAEAERMLHERKKRRKHREHAG